MIELERLKRELREIEAKKQRIQREKVRRSYPNP